MCSVYISATQLEAKLVAITTPVSIRNAVVCTVHFSLFSIHLIQRSPPTKIATRNFLLVFHDGVQFFRVLT